MQKPSDSSVCLVNVIYDSSDPDHPSDAKKGIREERFFYKEAGETEWTEGRFPSEVEMGKTYLVRYEAKDIEGTWSYPAVAGIKTNEAREYVRPDDTTPPVCLLTVSRDTAEAGETIYIEAEAADDVEEIPEAEEADDVEEIPEAEAVEEVEELSQAEDVEDLEEVLDAEPVDEAAQAFDDVSPVPEKEDQPMSEQEKEELSSFETVSFNPLKGEEGKA